jgi:hypothetical protein
MCGFRLEPRIDSDALEPRIDSELEFLVNSESLERASSEPPICSRRR